MDNNWIGRILKFFNTAPKVRSDKFLEIEKAGRINELLEAIEMKRKGLPQNKVTRVK